jgi:hypothetical protein
MSMERCGALTRWRPRNTGGSKTCAGSLTLAAIEIRNGTAQSKPANRASLVGRYNDVYSRPDDIALANLVAKGRRSNRDLTEGEKTFCIWPTIEIWS